MTEMTPRNIVHFKKNAKWAVYTIAAVVPLADANEHERFNPDCPCLPKWDDNILIHEALDGRAQYE